MTSVNELSGIFLSANETDGNRADEMSLEVDSKWLAWTVDSECMRKREWRSNYTGLHRI